MTKVVGTLLVGLLSVAANGWAAATAKLGSERPQLLADVGSVHTSAYLSVVGQVAGKIFVTGYYDMLTPTQLMFYSEAGGPELAISLSDPLQLAWPSSFVAFNEKLYFNAVTGGGAPTIEYDPATKTPTIVNGGVAARLASWRFPAVFNGEVFCGGEDLDDERFKLWAMDSSGVFRMVYDFPTLEEYGGRPQHLQEFRGKLYFSAIGDTTGRELFSYAGGNSIPGLVADIVPGTDGSDPQHLTVFGDKLYFVALDLSGADKLFVFDDTLATVTQALVTATVPAGLSRFSELTEFDNQLLFVAQMGPGESTIFSFNGTDVSMPFELELVQWGSPPAGLQVFENELHFSMATPSYGIELFKVPRGSKRKVQVTQFNRQTSSGSPQWLTVHNGQLYFSANDGTHGKELWQFNSSNGASMVQDFVPGQSGLEPTDLVSHGDSLVFIGNFPGRGKELGELSAANELRWLSDLAPGTGDSGISSLCSFRDLVYFSASYSGVGEELWSFIPGRGVKLVADVMPGGYDSSPKFLTVANDTLFFFARSDYNLGTELHQYTPEGGVELVADIATSWSSTYVSGMTQIDGQLYVVQVYYGNEVALLARYDASLKKLVSLSASLEDFDAQSFKSSSRMLVAANGHLFFSATSPDAGTELLSYSPSSSGWTSYDLVPGSSSSRVSDFAIFEGKLVLVATVEAHLGTELYQLDIFEPSNSPVPSATSSPSSEPLPSPSASPSASPGVNSGSNSQGAAEAGVGAVSSGLSAGAIAGIAVAGVVVLGVATALAYTCGRRSEGGLPAKAPVEFAAVAAASPAKP